MQEPPTGTRLADLAEEYFVRKLSHDPFTASMLGEPGYADQVPDPSRTAAEEHLARLRSLQDRLAALPPSGPDEQVTRRVLARVLEGDIGEIAFGLNDFAISASVSAPQTTVFQVCGMPGAASLDRLAALPEYFASWSARYQEAAHDGRFPQASGVQAAITQLDVHLARPLDDDPMLRPLADVDQARALIADRIRPAIAAFRDDLANSLLPQGRSDDQAGVCHTPGGAEAYADAVARHTRPGLTADEIHEIGLTELAGIHDALATVGQRALGTASAGETLAALRNDPALRFGGSGEIVAMVEAALGRATAVLPKYFRPYRIPECVTREVDVVEAETAPLAYYQPPAADGGPGTHWVTTTEPHTRFRYEYEALAFHEAVPGHHLQISVAQTLEDLPRFRRQISGSVTAHVEGWGLYAEQLADEMDLYTSDITRLGRLSADAWRACRLVVDTGMHHRGWSRARAIAFLRDNTATTETNVRNEIDRYLAWPGQALAYLIGKREILRLREAARTRLGLRFDLAEFHHQVIGHGALPLDVLGSVVTGWS
ncbi:DUF885 domain-containing protein [Amycolatopsis jejuensis]|uniref:DUF885 domain-containing protein n=1 Tax=Amycolatopsis jejuensis TaxID=330084 RepID=UPI00068B4A0A|nr:DUF885 domain-containing protein [Amycolatopsis jejuensis]